MILPRNCGFNVKSKHHQRCFCVESRLLQEMKQTAKTIQEASPRVMMLHYDCLLSFVSTTKRSYW